jgi:hypothetical protein
MLIFITAWFLITISYIKNTTFVYMGNMKKYWIAILFFAACSNSYAQNYKIQKAAAFFTISLPGMIPEDGNGNKLQPLPVIERFIYIEINYKSKPRIDSVLYNSFYFKCSADAVQQNKITVGVNTATGMPVVITAKKGNRLWKLSLQQPAGSFLAHEDLKKILLKVLLGKIKIKQVLTAEIQLNTYESN